MSLPNTPDLSIIWRKASINKSNCKNKENTKLPLHVIHARNSRVSNPFRALENYTLTSLFRYYMLRKKNEYGILRPFLLLRRRRRRWLFFSSSLILTNASVSKNLEK